MEKTIQSLYDRLNERPERQLILIGLMDGAINEITNSGLLSCVSPEMKTRIHPEDPYIRIEAKSSIAKSYAYSNFIKETDPVILDNGDLARLVQVDVNANFINSICLCIQGSIEESYIRGGFKDCENEIMKYFILTDAVGAERNMLEKKIAELDSLYDNYQIIVRSKPDNEQITKKKKTKYDIKSFKNKLKQKEMQKGICLGIAGLGVVVLLIAYFTGNDFIAKVGAVMFFAGILIGIIIKERQKVGKSR